MTGGAELVRYCDEKAIPVRLCGKLIVATDESELSRLADLERRAVANGCAGIRMVGADEIRELEPHVRRIRALWSPKTGIVDYGVVARSYADDVLAAGGEIRTSISHRHHSGAGTIDCGHESWRVRLSHRRHLCRNLLGWVARMTGASHSPVIAPFRGDYYVMSGPSATILSAPTSILCLTRDSHSWESIYSPHEWRYLAWPQRSFGVLTDRVPVPRHQFARHGRPVHKRRLPEIRTQTLANGN